MTAADDPRERWRDSGSPGYQLLPEPVALEETIALHPVEPAEPRPIGALHWVPSVTVAATVTVATEV